MSLVPGRPGRLAVVRATLGAALFGLLGTPVFGTAAVALGWIGPRGHLVLWLCRRWSQALLACSGVRVEASFEQLLDRGRSYVFLSNHLSYYDIPALVPAIPNQVRFAAKRPLFRIPFFGWTLAVGGFIPIDRDDRSRAREAFAAAAARLRAGVSVLFFPEGTRSPDGRLGAFERGGFLLALKSGLPIVPVGISGSYAVMPKGRRTVAPGPVRLRFGPPIEVAAYGVRGKGELIAQVRREISRLAGLEDEAEIGTQAVR